MVKQTASLVRVLTLVSLVVGGLIVGAYGWFQINQKPISQDDKPVAFVVKRGETVDSIAKKLVETKLIRSIPVFKIIVMRDNIATKIQAGSFVLRQNMSTKEVAQTLTSGRQDIWVTVLEGWRREEIAAGIKRVFSDNQVDFDEREFLSATTGKEGLLFPDTYLFPLDANASVVASILENTFKQKITDKMRADIESQGKTLNQVITMASLIEREAKTSTARKMVSGILWKRIENDWPLQVDATLQYAKGYDSIEQTWWKPPLAIDKEIKSAYNTYQNQGLPPGPICSPSFDSIMAAIYPTPSENWFYITDNQGQMHYAETIDQHNQNVNTYLR